MVNRRTKWWSQRDSNPLRDSQPEGAETEVSSQENIEKPSDSVNIDDPEIPIKRGKIRGESATVALVLLRILSNLDVLSARRKKPKLCCQRNVNAHGLETDRIER
jgi:hypothetical protein